MGKLLYGDSGIEIEIEDRLLAHLQLVIGAKLRRKESFFFSWRDDPASGDGRSSIWMDVSIPIFFKYRSSRVPEINREWIDLLIQSSHSGRGLEFIPEPGEGATAPPASHV
jgi:hypothetical protein